MDLRYIAQECEIARSFTGNGVLLLIILKFLLNHCKLVTWLLIVSKRTLALARYQSKLILQQHRLS